MQKIVFFIGVLFSSFLTDAQDVPNVVKFTVIDEDTIIISKVPEVEILAFKDYDDKLRYFILKLSLIHI